MTIQGHKENFYDLKSFSSCSAFVMGAEKDRHTMRVIASFIKREQGEIRWFVDEYDLLIVYAMVSNKYD